MVVAVSEGDLPCHEVAARSVGVVLSGDADDVAAAASR